MRTLAESEFSQPSQLSDELERQVFHNETSRERVEEIRDLVALMSINPAALPFRVRVKWMLSAEE